MSSDLHLPGLGRRTIVKGGMAAATAAMLPAGVVHAQGQEASVPRDKTLVLIGINSRDGRWVDHELWNPYAIGANHQNGPNLIYEPLAYYSAFGDKWYMWLAESYKFTPGLQAAHHQDAAEHQMERRRAVQRRGRRLYVQHAARPRAQGEMGHRRQPGAGQGDRDRPQHGRAGLQDSLSALLLLRHLQIRHRRLYRAEAHLPGPGLAAASSTSIWQRAGRSPPGHGR